ncbi:MAG: lipopolysaccharide transport system ATP-binding protein [Thermoleophilaceae bacterium]|nr:lipopolysaccharide transport system ATP-binding protein [Thermoleophilaceae bacterium]
MASIAAGGLGVRFLFDRQGRPVTPGIARIRRHCEESWGLRGVDFEVEPGETVALVGANGAGKTTLLRALAGVYEPDEGTLSVSGSVGALLSVSAGLLPRLNGRENAMLLSVLAGMPRAEARAGVEAVGERAGLGDAFGRPSSSYSAGEKARLGLAVIERAGPDVLLLDEVHEALDAEVRESLLDTVRRIADRGGIVVAAGHDLGELERMCTRALLFDDGRLVADGSFEDVALLQRSERTHA